MTSLPLHLIRYCIDVYEVMILRASNIYISHPLTFHVIFHFSAFWRFLRRHHRNQEEFLQEIPHLITFYKACHVSSIWIIEWHRCILLITGPDTHLMAAQHCTCLISKIHFKLFSSTFKLRSISTNYDYLCHIWKLSQLCTVVVLGPVHHLSS